MPFRYPMECLKSTKDLQVLLYLHKVQAHSGREARKDGRKEAGREGKEKEK